MNTGDDYESEEILTKVSQKSTGDEKKEYSEKHEVLNLKNPDFVLSNEESLPPFEHDIFSIEDITKKDRKCIIGIIGCILNEQEKREVEATKHSMKVKSVKIISNKENEKKDSESKNNISEELRSAKIIDQSHELDENINVSEEDNEEDMETWQKNYFILLVKYMEFDESVEKALLPLLRNETNPQPFKESMSENWKTPEGRLKILTVLLHFSVCVQKGLDARVQVLLKSLANVFDIPWIWYRQQETRYPSTLKEIADEEMKAKNSDKSRKRWKWAKVGFLAVAGGAAIAITGGLAAPAVGVGLASIGIGGASFLATTTGAALFGTFFGAAGTKMIGYKAQTRYGDVEEFTFDEVPEVFVEKDPEEVNEQVKEEKPSKWKFWKSKPSKPPEEHLEVKLDMEKTKNMEVVIAISGWMSSPESYKKNWLFLKKNDNMRFRDIYTLKWETKHLLNLGSSIKDFATDAVKGEVTKQILTRTVFQGLLMALSWPMTVLNFAKIIDNPWSVVMSKASMSGLLLADAICQRAHGNRPLVLIGYSTGASIIFHALEELARRRDEDGEDNCEGVVLDVILIGAPVTGDKTRWMKVRSVVHGKIVNCYLASDWVLRFLYRTVNIQIAVAGLGPVNLNRIHNVNLDGICAGHYDYPNKLREIMDQVQLI